MSDAATGTCRHCGQPATEGEHCTAAPTGRLSASASAPHDLTIHPSVRATNPGGQYEFLRRWIRADSLALAVAREEALRATRRGE